MARLLIDLANVALTVLVTILAARIVKARLDRGEDEKLADALIRVLDCTTGLDLDTAVTAKPLKNRGRGYRHGGKRL